MLTGEAISISPEANGPQVCQHLLEWARDRRISDLHLQPQKDESATVSARLDGVIRPVQTLAPEISALVIGRLKFLAKLKTFEHSLPQDGRITETDSGIGQELRVSTYPTITGEKVVIRFFSTQAVFELEQLGLDLDVLTSLHAFLRQRQGLMLLTGPSGSGKTTTIYSCLKHVANTDGRHVITVEDPVEQQIDGIMQTEINEARGLTFVTALRHLMRQDPELLVIGEIRDDTTAEIAVRACLTGHQVIATLHAGSCQSVIDRLQLMVQDRHALSCVLSLVLNQRLLRRACEPCRGQGCDRCSGSGYRDRIPIVEKLKITAEDRTHWQADSSRQFRPQPTLRDAAQRLVELNVTDQAEVDRSLGS